MNIKLNIDGKEYEVIQTPAKKPLPKTWKELEHRYIDLRYLPNKYIALRKLEILRDIYNDGWKADWSGRERKWCIEFSQNMIYREEYSVTHCFLHFRTPKLRDEFLRNFAGLIDEARELL